MITANWKIQCNVDCPYCDYMIDLISEAQDSFEWLPQAGVSEKIEQEVTCPKCDRDFIVQETAF